MTWWVRTVGFVAVVLLTAAACTSATDPVANSEPTAVPAASVEERCQQGAKRVVDRLQAFIGGFGDSTPEQFLGQSNIDGLGEFQDDVAAIIAETANQNSTLCNLDGLQAYLDNELDQVESDSLLSSYLIASIRDGGVRETATVRIGPDDDIEAIVALLADGSTVTLDAGTYELTSALLFQNDIAIVGAGVQETVISSSSSDAALAVFGQGKLTLRDLTVEHVGDSPASVVLAFGAPVDLERVQVRGASISEGSNDEAGGGNGVLLSTGTVGEDGVTQEPTALDPDVAESRIVDSDLTENAIAGITVIGDLSPYIADNRISNNTLCGLCYLGESAGTAENNTVLNNEFGIQVGDSASPQIVTNAVSDNRVAGIVVLAQAVPAIQQNSIANNGEVGIAIQGSAAPAVVDNEVVGQTFGFTIVGSARPQLSDNSVTDAEVGMQIGEDASPTLASTTVTGTEGIGFVFRDNATGVFQDIVISGSQAVGFLVEGSSSPTLTGVTITAAEVGMSYREMASGELTASTLSDNSIGIQVEDQAAPVVRDNEVLRAGAAAMVIRTTSPVRVEQNVISESVTLGIGLAGESQATLVGNEIRGGETAISFVDEAAGEVRDNRMQGQIVAMQIGDSAMPLVAQNRITDAVGAAIVYRDVAGGEAVENSIVNPSSVGIQVVDQAGPELRLNALVTELSVPANDAPRGSIAGVEADPEIGSGSGTENDVLASTDPVGASDQESGPDRGAEPTETEASGPPPGDTSTVGILFAGTAQGVADGNQVLGFVIGVQVSDSATPEIVQNVVDGGQFGGVGLLYRDDAGGTASGNRTTAHSIGVQVSDQAAPTLQDNTVEQVADVAFLFQGTAAGTVDGNSCPSSVPGIGLLAAASPELGTNACGIVGG